MFSSISENGSIEASVASVTSPSGGRVAIIRSSPDLSTPKVKVINTGARLAEEKPSIGEAVYGYLNDLLQKGVLIPNRTRILDKGLLSVDEGFDLQRQRKVRLACRFTFSRYVYRWFFHRSQGRR